MAKEKVIISQEKFADNMIYVKDSVNELYSHAANIRCVSDDASKPIRTLSVRMVAPSATYTNNQIVVNVPNVRKPVPLFILMRALGVISDRSIIECCLLDLEKNTNYVDLFIPSVHDAGKIFTQAVAIKYIGTFTKGKTIEHVLDILSNYLLPQIGELNFRDKACYLGYMVFELLKVFRKENKPTDRDSFKYKRVEVPGILISELFKEYYTLQQRNIYLRIDKEYNFHQGRYQNNFKDLITGNYIDIFQDRIVADGIKKGFKGNWGAASHTKRLGIVQDLNRLSFNSYISLMRKINLPLDSSAKIVGPRLLHGSQWGIIDPFDTPDGGNIGLHKYLSILTKITKYCPNNGLINWLRYNTKLFLLNECSFKYLSKLTKIFINHAWIGGVENPEEIKNLLINSRRNGIISIYTGINWDIKNNAIFLSTDSGRLCHPVYYIDRERQMLSINNKEILDKILSGSYSWNDLLAGFTKKNEHFNINDCTTYLNVKDLYNTDNLESLRKLQGIIEYIDTAEEESALIAIEYSQIGSKDYTHMEIHPSLLLGVMGNLIIYPENNPLPRDLFSCGQSKQAVSLYHSNYLSRIDKSGLVLNYGQIPLVKSRYLKYINNEEHPYGENVIVAIMCYGGYNVEDSILFNEGSVKRGLFNTTYYNMYEDREESSKVGGTTVDSRFSNIYNENVIGLKPGYDYSDLNDIGLIKQNTRIDDKSVIIGKVTTNLSNPNVYLDASTFPKKGQLGYVDRAFITENEEGFRLAKVRVREERIPAIGDKFCSRCGQKGTIGLIIPEEDMPFTEDGIRPDLIINPHALPSRMTIGQLLETVIGKACAKYGAFGDCTAFINKGSKYEIFGKLLVKSGFSSTGNEILYNGQNGEQLVTQIFIGPTYYMRLKHMVKDKINYRAQGPRTVLTRQPVQGRANDGGLRIGELERDAIIAHGISFFLKESLLVRGDQYFMAVCNLTGLISIYNPVLDLFISPYADGPIKFVGSLDSEFNIERITKYGRSFSVLRIPYAFKVLIQELATLNVQMRLITEENIDQIYNMAFSNEITNIAAAEIKIPTSISDQQEKPEEGFLQSTLDTVGDYVKDGIISPIQNVVEQVTGFDLGIQTGEKTKEGIKMDIQEIDDEALNKLADAEDTIKLDVAAAGDKLKTGIQASVKKVGTEIKKEASNVKDNLIEAASDLKFEKGVAEDVISKKVSEGKQAIEESIENTKEKLGDDESKLKSEVGSIVKDLPDIEGLPLLSTIDTSAENKKKTDEDLESKKTVSIITK